MTKAPLYHLALRAMHTAHGATFVEATGWTLPGSYGDPEAEHRAVREAAAVADLSHHSQFIVSGTDAEVVLARAFAGRVGELDEGRALRTAALTPDGTIADLALIVRTGGISYAVVGEPGQRDTTAALLRASREEDFDVRIEDRTETTCLVSVAGPAAQDLINRNLAEGLPARLQTMHAVAFEFHGFRALAVRTSAVGEDGFLFMLAPAVAQHLIETLREAGLPLLGRIASEALRVESCLPAFDPDLTGGLTPAEADVDLVFQIDGGRDTRILSAVLFESQSVPPSGSAALHQGRAVGEVRSSVYSFGLRSAVGLAVLDRAIAVPGATLDVGGVRATIVAKPLHRRRA